MKIVLFLIAPALCINLKNNSIDFFKINLALIIGNQEKIIIIRNY